MTLLSLAGWHFRLACAPPSLAEAVAARYQAFRVPDGPPADFTLTVEAGHAGRGGCEHGLAGVLDAISVDPQQQELLDASGICGRIDGAGRHALLTLQAGDPVAATEYFLRLACAVFAYRHGGLLVHGAALLSGRRAHVFVGPSGSGKSTIVALSRDHVALNDDLVLLRPGDEGWTAHGTPFWNLSATARTGQTLSGRIAAFYTLVKDDRPPSARELSRGAAVAALVANCPVVNGAPGELPGLLARCAALAATAPVRELHFRKDAGFWAAIADPGPGSLVRRDRE